MAPIKKIFFVVSIFTAIVGMSSCDYDDSNDIDILTPTDSVETKGVISESGI